MINMPRFLVGVDIGTSSVKAAAFDETGVLIQKASTSIDIFSPQPGWVEQEPSQWWEAVCTVLKELTRGIDPEQIVAVGLSGQCPGHVLVDAQHRSLGRAIIWSDHRAVEEAKWLSDHISTEQAVDWIGSSYIGDSSCPPARLMWLNKHRHEDVEKSIAILQPKEFIALNLTGEIHTDSCSAYCLINPQTNTYHEEYFATLGFPIKLLPPVTKATALAGKVTGMAGRITGLRAGTPVIIGTIDAYCDNLAGGVLYPGRAVDVAGTSEIVSLAIPNKLDNPAVYATSLDDSGYWLCNPMQCGGDVLRWLANCFYPEFGRTIRYDLMEKEAASVPAGSGGLVFLPYLSGERAPIWDSEAKGAFIGVTSDHSRQHFTRAVYESIGFAIRHTLDVSETAAGFVAKDFVICGGGSRSQFWNQVKADILQRIITPTVDSQTGCLGAVILAGVGVGIHKNLQDACGNMIQTKTAVEPDIKNKNVYEKMYQWYREYYPALKTVWDRK
jgi:xylulokinase